MMKPHETMAGAWRTLAISLMASAAPAFAQDADVPPRTALSADGEAAAAPEGPRTYAPGDFVRFAPRSALDMLQRVPGFAIDEGDTSRRGLGQATGNVLINGERFLGRSTNIFTELRQISAANVVRIEIVDGASLNVSGLTGQVANVVTASRQLSGNFAWRPQIRARRTPVRLLDGEVSVTGAIGSTQYTLSARNQSRRNGNAGPEIVFTPDGEIIDRRVEELFVNVEQPRIAGSIRRAFGDGSLLNLSGGFELYHSDVGEDGTRSGPGQADRARTVREIEREYNYDFGGDYEFALGGGRLKLIGSHRFEHSPFTQTLVETYADGSPTLGQRFTQVADEAETILRAEYRWRGGGDWQVSVEGALNSLDIQNGLQVLDPGGDFVPVPFPNAEGKVEEQRAEAVLTYGRPLASNLILQASLGGEYSEISQSGPNGQTRGFFRPKGFLNLAWRPRDDLDISARIERQVGQLNFFDFVASTNVSGGTVNAGNADLVPPQSWNAQIQATRNLGPWGTATARVYGRLISDVVDVVPIGPTGQAPGNLDGLARVYGLQWTSTFNFDPLGWRGARLDMNLQFQRTSLEDALTGLRRPINDNMTRRLEVNLRHDVPGTAWAWGASAFQYRQSQGFRLDQSSRSLDTPGTIGLFVEHKDVMGLTVRATVDNIFDSRETFRRTFFDGRRNPANSNVAFTEYRDRDVGPIFTLSISGTI